jgi:hypothetical protein
MMNTAPGRIQASLTSADSCNSETLHLRPGEHSGVPKWWQQLTRTPANYSDLDSFKVTLAVGQQQNTDKLSTLFPELLSTNSAYVIIRLALIDPTTLFNC